MKPGMTVTTPLNFSSLRLAVLALVLSASGVQAQNRICVVDDISWEVVCGRSASAEEVSEYYSRRNQTSSTRDPYVTAPAYRPQPPIPAPVVQPAPVYVPAPPAPVVVQQPVIVPAPQPNLLDILVQAQAKPRPAEHETRMTEREANRQVNRLFQEVLGREADFTALQNFSNVAINGRPLTEIRLELARSEEAKQAIRRIYREVLGRDADPNGLNNFQQKLINGATLAQIRNELANSDEAKRRR